MKNLIRVYAIVLLVIFFVPAFSQSVLKRAENKTPKNDKKVQEIPQESVYLEPCAFEEVNAREAALPNSTSLLDRELSYKSYLKTNPTDKVDGVITVIPVVVHVIHTGQAEGVGANISDAQIESAITQLNNNFRKVEGTHGDADGVDTEIEFCLASIDPDGLPTDGIVRVDGSNVVGYEDDGVCVYTSCTGNELAIKNLSRWPNNQYYNIWVVTEIMGNDGGYGIQGFAYFPGSSSLYDGTIIMNTCFGSIGTVNSWNNMGRTLTHEVAHGMGLYHSFEGDNGGSSCPTGSGDYVSDTDPHKRSMSNCPSGTNICTGTTSQDVVHNYMDYSSQTCADMFTQGQSDRMNTQIAFFRSSLSNSTACTIDDINDLAITQVVTDQSYQCGSSYTPIVSLYNIGSQEIDTVEFTYSFDGGASSTYTWINTLSSGDSTQVSLPTQTLSYATHTFSVSALPSQADSNLTNNDATITFQTINEESHSVEIELDLYGSENSWEVLDADLNVLAFGGPFLDNQAGMIISEEVCIPTGCNQFVFYESYGDGMGSGSYSFSDSDGNVIASGWSSPNASSFPTAMFESSPIGGPETSVTASESSVCAGTSVTLTASGGDSYSWSTGQSSTSITVSPSETTTYSVTAEISACSGNEEMITVEILDAPVAIISPADPSVCEGESITLSASGGSSYEWSTGETGNSITISPSAAMNISVIPTNTCVGDATTVNVEVVEIPTTTVNNNSYSICEGSSLTLVASGGESYFWNTGSSSAEMTVAPSTTTTYSVTAYNGSCAGNTEEVEVLVNLAPYAGPSTEVDFCSSEGAQDLIDYLFAADEDGQWYDTEGDPFNGILMPSNDPSGDYLYVVSGNGECEDASASLTVNIVTQLSAGSSTSITVSSGANEIDLFNYLAGADAGGSWSDPNGDAFDGFFDPAEDGEGMYVYSFTSQSPCNGSSAVVSVSLSESSNAGSSTSVYFCSGDEESNLFPLLMGADAGGTWTGPDGSDFNGLIDPSTAESGGYTYSIGESTATITVTISETPEPLISTSETSYELNEVIAFSNVGSTLGNSTWNFGDDATSTLANPEHSYTNEGFYQVTLTLENGGCVASDDIGLIIMNTSTGITEAFIEQQLLIYPNPGFGMFKMRFNLGKAHDVRYDVINSNGKLLSTSGLERVSEAEYSINLIAQSMGYYFVRFYVDDLVVTKKLLKTN
jgi:hypothetical protein